MTLVCYSQNTEEEPINFNVNEKENKLRSYISNYSLKTIIACPVKKFFLAMFHLILCLGFFEDKYILMIIGYAGRGGAV